MFDFNWEELILIGIVALVAIGPKELPGALRTLGQWIAKFRRMANQFQDQFHEAMREAELAELKKEVDEMASKAQSYAHFDAIGNIRKVDLENAAPHEFVKPLPRTPETAGSHSPSPVVDTVAESTPPLVSDANFPLSGATPRTAADAAASAAGSETSPATVEPKRPA
jgi:sec-independent protein translocase protein TatB